MYETIQLKLNSKYHNIGIISRSPYSSFQVHLTLVFSCCSCDQTQKFLAFTRLHISLEPVISFCLCSSKLSSSFHQNGLIPSNSRSNDVQYPSLLFLFPFSSLPETKFTTRNPCTTITPSPWLVGIFDNA